MPRLVGRAEAERKARSGIDAAAGAGGDPDSGVDRLHQAAVLQRVGNPKLVAHCHLAVRPTRQAVNVERIKVERDLRKPCGWIHWIAGGQCENRRDRPVIAGDGLAHHGVANLGSQQLAFGDVVDLLGGCVGRPPP